MRLKTFEKAAEHAYGTPDIARLITDLRERARKAAEMPPKT
ncbi:MAG: hypothetical protein AB1468_00490 [Candidatus Micrarchaeota archaeon]